MWIGFFDGARAQAERKMRGTETEGGGEQWHEAGDDAEDAVEGADVGFHERVDGELPI